ncbi:hypothetical protein C8K30_101476 [Promicromonospora sp. AC04]|uniref:hypothetical protein n=1 Tax=Promicromonospora sp. AC04 TaxID=2135723 RepID=UPI000D37ECA1|nr:hypothetical protein [Promicromonospora sp. AC04]PUB31956.1 hypothetical protein C8K30_101476 [Promicromonospora sp. AC04]
MGIYFALFPVDSDLVQQDEEWLEEYTDARYREFWEWKDDQAAAVDDPRGHVMLRYQHHYMNLINPYLEAAYDIEPYSWFAGEQVGEFYYVKQPDEVTALAATLSRPAGDVRERLDSLARANLDMVGTWTPLEGLQAIGTVQGGTVDQVWELIHALHAELLAFLRRASDGGQTMIGHFSP